LIVIGHWFLCARIVAYHRNVVIVAQCTDVIVGQTFAGFPPVAGEFVLALFCDAAGAEIGHSLPREPSQAGLPKKEKGASWKSSSS